MALFKRRTKATRIARLQELESMISSGKPVLLDFMQVGCSACRVMDGIVDELAGEYGESAHIVKVDVKLVPGAAQQFNVRSTPTFVLIGTAPPKKKSKKSGKQPNIPARAGQAITPRFRQSGLVKKDQLARVLESNGAVKDSG